MRKLLVLVLTLGLASTFYVTAPASANNIGNEGCTLGYWKNHTDNWYEDPTHPISTDTLLNSAQVGFVTTSEFAGTTLLEALSLPGGPGLLGAERILLRQAAAAWLNAAHEDVGYPYRRFSDPYNIVATVNAAIASGSRAQMLEVASELDAANNLGCPLN